MSETSLELHKEQFDTLNPALDELKSRFLALAASTNTIRQSFETAAKSFLSMPRIVPVLVPKPMMQAESAHAGPAQSGAVQPGTAQSGGIGDTLVGIGKKALGTLIDKVTDKLIGKGVEKAFGGKTGETAGGKKRPIGFEREEEAAAQPGKAVASWRDKLAGMGTWGAALAKPVSRENAGTSALLAGTTAVAAYAITSRVYPGARSGDKTAQTATIAPRQQTASVLAAMPVFVTNWPAPGAGTVQAGGEAGFWQKRAENALDKTIDKVLDKTIDKAIEQIGKLKEKLTTKTKSPIGFGREQQAGRGALSLIGGARSFLPASWLGRLATMGRVGAALAAPVGTASVATTAGLVTASAAAGYGIGTLLNKGMGWISDKLSGGKYGGEGWLGSMVYDLLHPSETQVQNQNTINVALKVDKDNRMYAATDDMDTQVNLNRGQLLTGD